MHECMTATMMMYAMYSAILSRKSDRTSTAEHSPANQPTDEAPPFQTFVLVNVTDNVPSQRQIRERWARANVLYFFTGSEAGAEALQLYTPSVDKFVTGGRWIGAYGAAYLPSIRCCIQHLRKHPDSRRAVATAPGLSYEEDVNRPACWNCLHFLRSSSGLMDMHVYQRSLHLFRVMPYDCILLTNILLYVAGCLNVPCGRMYWTIGSLHKNCEDGLLTRESSNPASIVYDYSELDPLDCMNRVQKDAL
jgi:Thymidylate synthase